MKLFNCYWITNEIEPFGTHSSICCLYIEMLMLDVLFCYVNNHRPHFSSYDITDEMCWAGAWLYMVTQEDHYLEVAESNYASAAAWGQSWDEKNAGCMVSDYS